MSSKRVRIVMACVIALLAVALISGCNTQRSVTGKVVSGSTGKPMAGSVVVISDVRSVVASDGSFTIEKASSKELTGSVQTTGFPDTPFDMSKDQGTVVVRVPDAVLRLTVAERALQPKAMENYSLLLDGAPASAETTIEGLVPGVHRVELTGAKYLPLSIETTLQSGVNTLAVSPSLTATETYARMLYESEFNRDKAAYQYIHPDERRTKITLKQWTKNKKITQMTSSKLGEMRMLPEWRSKLMNQTYTNVAEIDRSLKYQVIGTQYSDFGRTYTFNQNQHWVLVDGLWYMVHARKSW
jgi:hypothetical protein